MFPSRGVCSLGLLWACAADPVPATSQATDLAALDCTLDDTVAHSLASRPTEVGTVQRVSWQTAETGTRVEFSEDGEVWQQTPAAAATGELEALVLGVPSRASITWRVRADGDRCSAAASFETGALPPGMPTTTLTLREEGAHDGFLVSTMITETGSYVLIFDGRGRIVWLLEQAAFVSSARLSRDRQAVLYNTGITEQDPNGHLFRVNLDGTVDVELAIEGFHTDFDEAADGVVALAREHRTFEVGDQVREIVGDKLVHMSWEGESTELWSAFDTFEFDSDRVYPEAGYPFPSGYEDWSHVNGVTVLDEGAGILLTVARMDAVVYLDGDTHAVRWVLGGLFGDFDQETALIDWPHSAHLASDGSLTVFNHNDVSNGGCAAVHQISVDTEEMVGEELSRYGTDECMTIGYLGQGLPMEGGGLIVTWSTAGQIDEVDADGELLLRLNTDLGAAFGFGDYADSLYLP